MAKERSTFMGPRLRRLRRRLGMTQAVMASELDVSPSYIALIERNHRPVSADLLIRLAEVYDLDIASFASAEDETSAQLEAALADPIFADLEIGREDIRDLTASNPALSEAIAALYQSYRSSQRAMLEARASGGAVKDPLEEARDFVDRARNYFPVLDEAGEELAVSFSKIRGNLFDAIARRLEDRHSLSVRILPTDIMVGAYRRLDRHRGQVAISEALDGASRTFQVALQLVLLEQSETLNSIVDKTTFDSESGKRLTKLVLANYAAASIMLPYEKFLSGAQELHYDIEALARRFGASFEQVAHRLTTLQRPNAQGIPFFFIRMDAAGNISKRYSGGVFPFARYGGSCPLWDVHSAFRTPRKILTQIIQLPEGDAFFSIARTVHGGAGGHTAPHVDRTVALGCELKEAKKLIYAQDLDLENTVPEPIGITCRLCTRQACAARAHPPLERRLIVDEHRRMATPFSFAFD